VLRTAFIGSHNEFDELLVDWLSRQSDLRGVVWTSSTEWQRTLRGKLEFARKRARRHGVRKAIDETAFYLAFHKLLKRRDDLELRRQVIEPYEVPDRKPHWRGDAITASNVNEPHVLSFLREREPDLALAMCITNYFEDEIRSIPRHGIFLWHEGFTPEYKGLYSPFWAAHNLDFDRIGYSLLRMNDEYDAGQVFAQGQARDVDPLRHGHLYMGHKAIWDSLPNVERLFGELERGEARPIDRDGAEAGMYTYPGLTDLIRQRMRFRRLARERAQTGPA
jgi:hypothetical protein